MSKTLDYRDIAQNDEASFITTITEEAVTSFAALSGDKNPLHVDDSYAATTQFGKRVVHGMYLGALVSRLIGMELPGTKALLVRESLTFKKPAYIDDVVMVKGVVTHTSDALKLITIAITITREGVTLAEGEVLVTVLP
jgi:acyl dehydratase